MYCIPVYENHEELQVEIHAPRSVRCSALFRSLRAGLVYKASSGLQCLSRGLALNSSGGGGEAGASSYRVAARG